MIRDIHFIFTARKRSLGQGNMLTGVCLSTGGYLVPGGFGLGVPGGDPPGRLLLRAVRILLECILVLFNFVHVNFPFGIGICTSDANENM